MTRDFENRFSGTQISPELASLCTRRAAELGPAMLQYWQYSRSRFGILLEQVGRQLESIAPPRTPLRLLDVGPSFQTLLFQQTWPALHIDTFGFADPKFPPPSGRRHLAYDLNDSWEPSSWPVPAEPYDLVVMAEVLEHLYASPVHVLRCLASMTRHGGFLLVTTPNAVALPKRLRVLRGRNPNEMIREDRSDPGHFREYTLAELVALGDQAELRAVWHWCGHAASSRSLGSRAYGWISPFLPPSLRKEITITYQRP